MKKTIFRRGRIANYLLYAIGEIILVVIGILLAVHFNNRYETAKTRESEKIFLTSLKKELSTNQEKLTIAMKYQERSLKANQKLLDIFDGDYLQFAGHELDSLFAEVQWTWTFDPELSVLNSIKTSGQISAIQNPQIRDFVVSYEEIVKDAEEESLIVRSQIVDKYVPLVNHYISEKTRANYIGYSQLKKSKFKSDHEGIFKNSELESILAYIYIWRLEELSEEKEILIMMKGCIDLVTKELAKN